MIAHSIQEEQKEQKGSTPHVQWEVYILFVENHQAIFIGVASNIQASAMLNRMR